MFPYRRCLKTHVIGDVLKLGKKSAYKQNYYNYVISHQIVQRKLFNYCPQ